MFIVGLLEYIVTSHHYVAIDCIVQMVFLTQAALIVLYKWLFCHNSFFENLSTVITFLGMQHYFSSICSYRLYCARYCANVLFDISVVSYQSPTKDSIVCAGCKCFLCLGNLFQKFVSSIIVIFSLPRFVHVIVGHCSLCYARSLHYFL